MTRIFVQFVVWLLTHVNLSKEHHASLVNCILDKSLALPIRDILTFNEDNMLLVNGRLVDYEKTRQLMEGAKALLDSPTRRFIRDQVNYKAVTIGIHQATTLDALIFSKAAIWYGKTEEEILERLANM